jgi:hypothetical protein
VVRRRALTVVLLVAGLFAGWVSAAGALAPVPPVPPVPTVPTLPALPPPPRPPQLPEVPLPKPPPPAIPSVPKPALPVGGGASGGSAGLGGGTSSGGSTSSGAGTTSPQGTARHGESRPARISRLHFSRDWISRTGPKKGRQTVLVFSLGKPAVVEFVVLEIAPDCRRAGRFRVLGRTGVNRLRFRGRIGSKALGPGTYRIVARALPRGRALVDTELVIVASPDPDEIASARRSNSCPSASGGGGQSPSSFTASAFSPANPTAAKKGAAERDKAEKPPSTTRETGGVLGARFTRRAVDAVKSIPLWLFALLGIAIAILAVAALPLRAAPTRRAASALAHHRGAVALTGAAVLVAVTVAYTLGLGAP